MQIQLLACAIIALTVGLSSEQKDDLTCGPPPTVKYASLSPAPSNESPLGTVVIYSCQLGYVVEGNKKTSQCVFSEDEEDVEWTDPEMSCIPRSCGDPGFLEYGSLIGSLFTFPNSVSFECDDGYRLVGNKQRYCLASGSWSGRLPRCESVSCDPPKDPKNGHVKYASLDHLSRLQFECDKGYRLMDDTPVYCTSDGSWSRTDIECVDAACKRPKHPEHGKVELLGSTPRAGTVAVFSCDGDRIPDGPTTSKCLENGQWTFETPQCLEPCTIPAVIHGRIGRYVSSSFSRTLTFKEVPVGSRIEDDEKLFLHCDAGYSPLASTTNWQERVACSRGKWSQEPFCEPKSCLEDIPHVPNAEVVRASRTHGGTIEYKCQEYFKKVKHGSINCEYGEWKGEKPICKDTRCSLTALSFPGIEKGNTDQYQNGEYYEVRCEKGYQLANGHAGELRCDNGDWRGAMPPCVAASCSEPPLRIENGRVEVTSTFHTSKAQYFCYDGYILLGNNKVQCLFGEWKGDLPKCSETTCSFKNLKNKAFVSSSENQPFTNSGDTLNVQCNDGYTPNYPLPMCYNGVWSRNDQPPCKEKDCAVNWISNGEIYRRVLGPKKWSFGCFCYQRHNQNEKIPYGTIPSRSETILLYCHNGYSFQGTGLSGSQIMCSEGRWSPDPVCLRTGTKYVPSTRRPITTTTLRTTTTLKTTPRTTSTTSMTTPVVTRTTRAAKITSAMPETEEEELTNTSPITKSTTEKGSFCEYTLHDDNVVGYADGAILNTYDRVKDGSTVQFWCSQVGLQHLVGQKELTCIGEKAWQNIDFPICESPKKGDAVIVYDNEVTVTMEGFLEVRKGQNVRLSCIAVEEAEYPKWTVPNEQGINVVLERMERSDDYLYISHLDLSSPTEENEGLYSCAVDKYPATTVEFRVVDPNVRCPMFLDKKELVVSYSEEENRLGTKASFKCLKQSHKLSEEEDLICLNTGQWSKDSPQCVPITCEEFQGTDLMQISYTDDQNIGSFANFHCFAPGRPEGVGRTRCLDNGQWQHKPPTCKTPPCKVEGLLSTVRKGIRPKIGGSVDGVLPYNSTIELFCDDDLALKGNSIAKCGKDGQWIVEEVECVSGCLPFEIPSSSNLIISPKQKEYKTGDTVSFTCMPGYRLDIEVELTMCINSEWSTKKIPECVDT